MSDTYTSNYNLTKIESGSTGWAGKANGNMDIIDAAIKSTSDSLHDGTILPFINVKDFGAKGDGVTDDSSSINSAITSTNGGTIYFPDGDYKITSPIVISSYGTTILGRARNSTTSSNGTRILNYGTSTHAFTCSTGVNSATIKDLSIIGQTGSSDGIYFDSGSIGHVNLINLYIEVKNNGINVSPGDGVHLYCEAVRIYGGNIPFNFVSGGVVINNITCVNCYAQNATSNSGFKIDKVGNFIGINSSSDNNFYGWEMVDAQCTFIGCTAENNSSKGFYGHGGANYTFVSPYTYSQLMPFEINNANANATFINPRTDGTPSGASINIASSNGDCTLMGRPLLDGGLQGSSQTNFALYTDSNGIYTGKDLSVGVVGKTLKIKEGSNAKMGTVALSSGHVTVSTTALTSSSRIFLQHQTGSSPGFLYVSNRINGTSFDITSSNGSDSSTIAWLLIEGL